MMVGQASDDFDIKVTSGPVPDMFAFGWAHHGSTRSFL